MTLSRFIDPSSSDPCLSDDAESEFAGIAMAFYMKENVILERIYSGYKITTLFYNNIVACNHLKIKE